MKLKHIETEGAILNIRTDLIDRRGRKIISIEILPDDHFKGERIWRTMPKIHNIRIVQLKKRL